MKQSTNRPSDLGVEDQIREEVIRIRREHPYRGDYREQLQALIHVLFFKFGERAGAARLVALLGADGRSPSTGTALAEINRFWQTIRDNAAIKLDRPDLPPFLLEIFADAAGKVWENALSQAEAALAEFRTQAEEQIRDAEARQNQAFDQLREARAEIDTTRQRAAAESEAREALAVELAGEKAARVEREKALQQLEQQAAEAERRRTEEITKLHRTIEDLQKASNRIEAEQRRLLVVADDYKTAAARDRELRGKVEDENRTLTITMQSMQGQVNRLHSEHGILQGRAESAEALAERYRRDRDEVLIAQEKTTAQVEAAHARIADLEKEVERLSAIQSPDATA
ncbi:DNA-binding protein [Caballeronia sp. EK]|uniref:DNA-binding protein n=1 Tax=Caballeronia sp. EK TaxID=2767469 RepID=UPI001654D0F8|nr:DNA-binding protein [Caballeronia sp. EK]MBC8641659.1 DNA-binding protein [Caballeronia sp. EK]